nr:MAG TPA: hypothetical protein [Caudoviricetes sp.]
MCESGKNVEMSYAEIKAFYDVLRLVIIHVHAANIRNVVAIQQDKVQRLAPCRSGESLNVKPQANGGRKIKLQTVSG